MSFGKGISNAGMGAAAGSAIAPGWGTAIGAAGGFISGLLSPDEQGKADEAKMQMLRDAMAKYAGYRPLISDARMNAMRQQQEGYRGAMNALATMYGPNNAQMPTLLNPLTRVHAADAAGPPANPYSDLGKFSDALKSKSGMWGTGNIARDLAAGPIGNDQAVVNGPRRDPYAGLPPSAFTSDDVPPKAPNPNPRPYVTSGGQKKRYGSNA